MATESIRSTDPIRDTQEVNGEAKAKQRTGIDASQDSSIVLNPRSIPITVIIGVMAICPARIFKAAT
jgi:hypothetical protein